ncbi:DNA mismatch repair protein MutT [Psychromonas sp. psych-6C06]|uniref:NUDIX hydrolase n=1 Tax=Psychromonas sp. psych-6C06 TaxID=2058089 RepID=UPI000C34C259|nr:NUDIX hydrolase [Psychromonas sp. psych-6C06]PKF62171.1 DNA mismatch repair protein MutT [Psychromonas sp. psych-6C06]
MRLLRSTCHPAVNLAEYRYFERIATRAIVLKGDKILLLYTERYDDYTLPGGGVDDGEALLEGFKRELAEETGAKHIRNIEEFGLYEEFRPWYKEDFDAMKMQSYCFRCEIDEQLGETKFEDYEIKNGMKAVWLPISEAIKHNQNTLAESDKKGMSVERELFLLKLIEKELLTTCSYSVG